MFESRGVLQEVSTSQRLNTQALQGAGAGNPPALQARRCQLALQSMLVSIQNPNATTISFDWPLNCCSMPMLPCKDPPWTKWHDPLQDTNQQTKPTNQRGLQGGLFEAAHLSYHSYLSSNSDPFGYWILLGSLAILPRGSSLVTSGSQLRSPTPSSYPARAALRSTPGAQGCRVGPGKAPSLPSALPRLPTHSVRHSSAHMPWATVGSLRLQWWEVLGSLGVIYC